MFSCSGLVNGAVGGLELAELGKGDIMLLDGEPVSVKRSNRGKKRRIRLLSSCKDDNQDEDNDSHTADDVVVQDDRLLRCLG